MNNPFGTQKNFGLPDSLLDAVKDVLKGKEELEEKKKLDPVGQEDGDVDNDGDVDDSDEYLKKRRKAIGKAMKGKKDSVEVDPKLDEEIELTEREDTAMQVARALKKMGVKPNAKEAEVMKKIPGILDKMKLSPGARRLISRDPDFIGDVFDSMNEGLEDKTDNPANSQHLCAKQVVHESWGEGTPIHGEHAEPDADGHIAWYDVMFDHGIEQKVSIDEMKVIKSAMHGSHKKKKMSEGALSEAPFMNHGSEAAQHRELSDKHRKFAEKARKEGNIELAKKHDMASQKHKEAMNHQHGAERERQDGGSDRNPIRLRASQKSMDAHKFGKSIG